MITVLIFIIIFLIITTLSIVYFNLDRIIKIFDNSLDRDRWWIKPVYENPVYFDQSSNECWPGWDGWYILFVPKWQDKGNNKPFNIIRISIMTGLYGVNGVDNYNKLRKEMITRNEAGESLNMVQTGPKSYLDQQYVDKNFDMVLQNGVLDVKVKDRSMVSGKWPHYYVNADNSNLGLKANLDCRADNVAWWANINGIFSYWSAFSNVKGSIQFKGKKYDLEGFGSFEHGWCKFLFQFNGLVQFARIFTRLLKIRLIYYHYEILNINDNFGAGTMLAGGPLGMNVRKRCETFFPNNISIVFDNTKIKYRKFKKIVNSVSNKEFKVPEKWEVFSENGSGKFTYTAEAKSPPAFIAGKMIYFDFICNGYYESKFGEKNSFDATGYGEYVLM